MPFTKNSPPKATTAALKAGLGDFMDLSDPLWKLLSEQYEAHEVFTLGLQDIPALTDQIDKAESIGWRFLACDPTLDGACHVSRSEKPKVTGIVTTPEVRMVVDRIQQLEERVAAGTDNWQNACDGEFAFRVLRIPSLLMEAFWLHGKDPKADILIPYAGFVGNGQVPNGGAKKPYPNGKAPRANPPPQPNPNPFRLMAPFSPKELLDAIKPIANKKLEMQKLLYPEDWPGAAAAEPKAGATKKAAAAKQAAAAEPKAAAAKKAASAKKGRAPKRPT
jgi:hypothetical protein